MFLFFAGQIIGWFNAVGDFCGFIFCVIALVLLNIYSCEDLKEFLKDDEEGDMDEEDVAFICSFGRGSK